MSVVQSEREVFWPSHLTADQTACVKELKALLANERSAISNVRQEELEDEVALCRFLKARKWQTQPARDMLVETWRWRGGAQCEPAEPPFAGSEIETIKKLYPHFYHKTDRYGRPVYYELIGELQLPELLKQISVERLVKLHILGWETTRQQIFPACSEAAGRRVFTCTAVLDLKGIKLQSFTADVRSFISQIAAIDQNYYPEHLGQMFIVNAPMVFKTIWACVRPWLEARTQRKIQVFSGDAGLKQLAQVIPPENLIKRLGGRSECDPCAMETVGPWASSSNGRLNSDARNSSSESALTAVDMDTSA